MRWILSIQGLRPDTWLECFSYLSHRSWRHAAFPQAVGDPGHYRHRSILGMHCPTLDLQLFSLMGCLGDLDLYSRSRPLDRGC